MKYLKKIFPLVLGLCVLILMGCGKTKVRTVQEKELDSLAQSLMRQTDFEFELSSAYTEDSFRIFFQEVPKGAKGYLYTSTTSSAELVLVTLLENEKDASAMKKQVDSYLEDERQEFVKYSPKEAKKLDYAIVEQNGCLLVAVVAEDTSEASEVLEQFLEEK